MDAADPRLFEAVARTGGIGCAAAELHAVQSNVKALEEELGTPLFVRHSRSGRYLPPDEDCCRMLAGGANADAFLFAHDVAYRTLFALGPEHWGSLW